MDYEKFKQLNIGWDNGFCAVYSDIGEEYMRRNYDIACRMAKEITESRQGKDFPVPGDIVAGTRNEFECFSGGCIERVQSHDLYSICGCPSIHTEGDYFSVSGGPFFTLHRSRLVKDGEGEQHFWTWGCHGSGAHQNIRFTAKVRKWKIVPDVPQKSRSIIRIEPHREGNREIKVELYGERGYIVQSFVTIKAFRFFAEYTGLKYTKEEIWGNGKFTYRCKQRVLDQTVWSPESVPAGSRPIKAFSNGTLTTCYVYCDDEVLVISRPNCNREDWYRPITDRRDYERYFNNPLGVE